jgi:hypothetical protein
MEIEMTAHEPLTQTIVNNITNDIMALVADILFTGKLIVTGEDPCLLKISSEVEASVRAIETTLSQLSDFTAQD